MMDQIFSYLKKNILIIGVVFCIGAYTGYKVLESAGMAALIANIPIPEGSIADKDAFIKNLPSHQPQNIQSNKNYQYLFAYNYLLRILLPMTSLS